LRAATTDLHGVQRQVEELLEAVVSGGRARFPLETGWRFTLPDEIDVYDAPSSVITVDALRRVGFGVVVLHGHGRFRVPSCRCLPWRDP